jgi:hypothetical protein
MKTRLSPIPFCFPFRFPFPKFGLKTFPKFGLKTFPKFGLKTKFWEKEKEREWDPLRFLGKGKAREQHLVEKIKFWERETKGKEKER